MWELKKVVSEEGGVGCDSLTELLMPEDSGAVDRKKNNSLVLFSSLLLFSFPENFNVYLLSTFIFESGCWQKYTDTSLITGREVT